MNYMKALGTYLLVKPVHREKTEGGIIMPEISRDTPDETQRGEVVSVGSGTYVGGKVDMEYEVGDIIYYRGGKGVKIKIDEVLHKYISITDILGKE